VDMRVGEKGRGDTVCVCVCARACVCVIVYDMLPEKDLLSIGTSYGLRRSCSMH
jgi:hypothetical protein